MSSASRAAPQPSRALQPSRRPPRPHRARSVNRGRCACNGEAA
jgi:hypothetical protein